MPADILLPLFTLTLLANAVLVVVAIRGLRRGSDPGRHGGSLPGPRPGRPGADRARTAEPAMAQRRPAAAAEARRAPEATERQGAPVPAEPGPEPRVAEPRAEAAESAPPPAPPATAPTDPRPAAPDPAVRSSDSDVAASAPVEHGAGPVARDAVVDAAGLPEAAPRPPRTAAPRSPGRGRRKFSLPPLDDDHEKVSRSIETFLAGGDDATPADPPAGAPSDGAPDGPGATTVAIVAIDGLRAPRRRSSRTGVGRDAGERPAPAAPVDALAMVERTLRGAARGSDLVSVDRAGRFRIVLPGTGELAARAYLRRVRASVEPILEASEDPLRLVVATATVLGRPVDEAIRAADRRMAAALRTARASVPGRSTDRADTETRPDHDRSAPAADDAVGADPRVVAD